MNHRLLRIRQICLFSVQNRRWSVRNRWWSVQNECWLINKYVNKSLPVLASITTSFSALPLLVYLSQPRIQLYGTPFPALLLNPSIYISPNFFGHTSISLASFPITLVTLFSFLISSNFSNLLLFYTDGSVSLNSSSLSYFIFLINTSFPSNLNSPALHFTLETYALIQTLQFLFSLNYL